ncbi:transposable element Tcb1 transposase [Trichonephila clavipes]|nr:transposable element Tcb1 transposase [Trichonephila clavipes]
MQITGNIHMAQIVRHNDESVRKVYKEWWREEVKWFTSAFKAFQCRNRIIMAQMKHLDDFLCGRIIGRLKCERIQLEGYEELGIAQGVTSRLCKRFQYNGNDGSSGKELFLVPETDLHIQNVTMAGHIYRDVILEQHVRFFRGAMGAEFLFMDDNAHPHHVNIVDDCLQSEAIGLTSILTRLESNRACVGYAWPTKCSPSNFSHRSTGTSEGIA